MKRILALCFFLSVAIYSMGQYPVNQFLGNDSTLITSRGAFRSKIINHTFTDTTQANLNRIKWYAGAQIYTSNGGGAIWVRNSTATGWVRQATMTNIVSLTGCYALLNGGIVSWAGTGLNMNVTPANYVINCNFYNSPSVLNLALTTAHPTLPRIDVIAVDTNSNVVLKTGTPATNPVKPQVNPAKELELTQILIPAAATTPSGYSQRTIYNENVEWTSSSVLIAGSADFNSTANPSVGVKNTRLTVGTQGYIHWDTLGSIGLLDYTTLGLRFNISGTSALDKGVYIFLKKDGVVISDYISLYGYGYGPGSTNGSYNQINIPFVDFNTSTDVFNGIGIYSPYIEYTLDIDYVQLQGGGYIGGSSQYIEALRRLPGSLNVESLRNGVWGNEFVDSAGAAGWKLTGNTGTNPATEFLGTGDAQPLVIKTNNTERARVLSTGNVGINESSPISKLHIRTDAIGVSQNDSNGIVLRNNSSAIIGVQQMSPGITWIGSAYRISGATSRQFRWRADVLPAQASASPFAYWQLSVSQDSGSTYTPRFEVSNTGAVRIWNDKTIGTFNTLNNAAIGYYSSNTLFFGQHPLTTSTGTNNIFVGIGSGSNNTSGLNNTGLGNISLNNNSTGFYNTAVGYSSLGSNTSGEQNAAFGMNSLLTNTTGIKNTAIGAGSMELTTTGSFNTGIGHDAMLQNTTGIENVGVGWLGWSQNRTGHYNVGVGSSSGRSVVNGSYNTSLGAQSMYLGSQEDTVNNSIALGFNSQTTRSNQWAISDSVKSFSFRGVSRGVAGYVLTDSLGNGEYWVARPASGGGSTNIYNTNGRLTGNRYIEGAGYSFDLDSANSIGLVSRGVIAGVNSLGGFYSQAGSASLETGSTNSQINSKIYLEPKNINLFPYHGNLTIDTLYNRTSVNTLMGWQNDSTGNTGYINIGSGLTLSGGTLSASGGSSGITVGTTTITGGTSGAIPFNNAGVYGEDATKLFWDNTNDRLAIGNNAPAYTVDVTGKARVTDSIFAGGVYRSTRTSGTIIYSDAGMQLTASSATGLAEWKMGNGGVDINAGGVYFNGGGNSIANVTATGFRTGTYLAATSTLDASSGSLALAIREITGARTLDATDHTINCTSGTFTVTLPATSGCPGRIYIIKNSGAGTITVSAADNIDGVGTYTLTGGAGKYVHVQSTSTTYIVIAQN